MFQKFEVTILLSPSTNIHTISLPMLRIADLESYSIRFLDGIHIPVTNVKNYENARREMHAVLEWLRDVAIGPIFDELGYVEASIGHCPRVWWVGYGLLNILPIHAAGYYGSGSTRNSIDRVISSYTPTIKSLLYARERNVQVGRPKEQRLMLVAMPGKGDLPFAEMEIKQLNSLLSPHIETTVVEAPERVKVLSALRDYQIVHFACHGYSSAENPSERIRIIPGFSRKAPDNPLIWAPFIHIVV